MKSKLIEMCEKYPQTELWTDSFHTADHAYGLTQGITGITTSPTWVSRMLCNEEVSEHEKVLCELQGKHPEYNEQEMIWAWTLEMGKRRSRVLALSEQGIRSRVSLFRHPSMTTAIRKKWYAWQRR